MAPVDDALDRLDYMVERFAYADGIKAVATVRSALEQLREERDALGNALAREQAKPGGSFDQWALLQAAEAEVTRLTNKLNEDSQNFEIECLKAERDRLEYRVKAAEEESEIERENAERAEAEVRRYREERDALREAARIADKLNIGLQEPYAKEMELRQAAEAEVQRLREGLREALAIIENSREFGLPLNVPVVDVVVERGRALLAASPSGGGGA